MARSAAYILAVLVVVMLVMGAILLTVLDPVAQAVFASSLWSMDTSAGSLVTSSVESLWAFWSLFVLLGLLSLVWITTRRPG